MSFTKSILILGIFLLFAGFLLNSNDNQPLNYDFVPTLRNSILYIFLYFTGFVGFYIKFRKSVCNLKSILLFCLVFLLVSPTIKSSTIIITETDSYHTLVFENETDINPGTPYNKLSTFASSLIDLITIKRAERFHNKVLFVDSAETNFERLGALTHSNTYQIHFFSVIIHFCFFLFLGVILNNTSASKRLTFKVTDSA